jgi:tetratricopeptide (TPR) repeat protein/cold shock CspA family protein
MEVQKTNSEELERVVDEGVVAQLEVETIGQQGTMEIEEKKEVVVEGVTKQETDVETEAGVENGNGGKARESEEWQAAEELRKAGNFEEAKPAFLKFFKDNGDGSSLWRAVHCARKLKLYEEALDLIESNKKVLQTSMALSTQFNWLRYEFLLDSYKKKSDWQKVVSLCEEILEDCSDEKDLLFRLVLFTGIDAAKKLDDYEKVLEFTGIIAPNKLPREGDYLKGKKMMSFQERWYYARLGALYEVSLYEECEEMVKEALKEFPRCVEFARKGAQCKVKLGKKEAAEQELEKLMSRRGCPWYVGMELANLRFEMGKFEEALQAAYMGAKGFGELKNKVNLFAIIAKIQLVLGDSESAKNHVALASAIREKQGWKFDKELQRLMARFGIVKGRMMPEIALKPCQQEWRESGEAKFKTNVTVDENKTLETEVRGRLGAIVPDRTFAFINRKNKNESIYVRLKDVPESIRKEGQEVVFDMIESLDKTKNRKSVRATKVRKAD